LAWIYNRLSVNAFAADQKVDWLNEVNYEFFDIVKIPRVFNTTANGTANTYTLPNDCREKNIRKVVAGANFYRSMVYEDITAAFNYFTLDDTTFILTLQPKPPTGALIVVYDKISSTPFVATNLGATPEAPPEYHWIYVLGLCTRMAKSMNDVSLANNYENDYKSNLQIAQQNYLRS